MFDVWKQEDNYNVVLIKATGERTVVGLTHKPTFKDVYPMINTDMIEIVSLSEGLEMWVDEEGLLKNKPLNKYATDTVKETWKDRGINHQPYIVGDVAVLERIEDD
jgi:hypothetical protein